MANLVTFFLSVVLGAFVVLIFNLFPELDLATSAHYYAPGQGFFMKGKWWVVLLHRAPPVLCAVIVIYSAFFGMRTLLRVRSFSPVYYEKILFVLLVGAIGPGVLVHYVFKESFSRPRPYQIVQFGGDALFHPPFAKPKLAMGEHDDLSEVKDATIGRNVLKVQDMASDMAAHSGQNHQHFSFPSGHAAVGYMMCVFGFMASGRRRYILWFGSVCLGLLFGWIRVIQGDHFLSDVAFSCPLVFATASLLYYVVRSYCQWDLQTRALL